MPSARCCRDCRNKRRRNKSRVKRIVKYIYVYMCRYYYYCKRPTDPFETVVQKKVAWWTFIKTSGRRLGEGRDVCALSDRSPEKKKRCSHTPPSGTARARNSAAAEFLDVWRKEEYNDSGLVVLMCTTGPREKSERFRGKTDTRQTGGWFSGRAPRTVRE